MPRLAREHDGDRVQATLRVKGSIADGTLDDFVMLEPDRHAVDPDDIEDVAVIRTVVSDRTVYPATT